MRSSHIKANPSLPAGRPWAGLQYEAFFLAHPAPSPTALPAQHVGPDGLRRPSLWGVPVFPPLYPAPRDVPSKPVLGRSVISASTPHTSHEAPQHLWLLAGHVPSPRTTTTLTDAQATSGVSAGPGRALDLADLFWL